MESSLNLRTKKSKKRYLSLGSPDNCTLKLIIKFKNNTGKKISEQIRRNN